MAWKYCGSIGYLCWALPVSLVYTSTAAVSLSSFSQALHSFILVFLVFSWFFTYNFLSEQIPQQETRVKELGRRALIGFCASAISDTCSNSIRVVKVYKQSHSDVLSYPECVKRVIHESGLFGLFFRGLETKLLANGLQGESSIRYTFSILFLCFFLLKERLFFFPHRI